MTEALARSDAVLHSIDVTGLGGAHVISDAQVPQTSLRGNAGRESLNLLAAETGGRFFKDANDLKPALAEMLEMTSRYYVLGIQPAPGAAADGAFHKVRVRVARKGVKLSHRPGYYERAAAPGVRTVLQRQFEAAELVMSGIRDGSEIRFTTLCLPFPTADGDQTLGLVVQVPPEELPWRQGERAGVELYGYAVGEDGAVKDHLARLTRLTPDEAGRGLSFFGAFRVPPGRYTLRLLVRDADSGASGLQLLDVNVPDYDPRAGFLLPPVVVDEVARWTTIEVGRAGARPGFPFEVGGAPFLPRASLELTPGRAERLVLFAYEPSIVQDPAADVDIRCTLVSRDGKPVRAGSIRIARVENAGSGRRTYVLDYTPAELSPGEYTLRVGVGEGRRRLEAYTLVRVGPDSSS
jgi:hypothetical protein